VIHKNKVVITPESRDKKGVFHSLEPNPKDNAWMLDVELNIGNDKKSHRGGTGVGIYYLKSVDKISQRDSIFGYSSVFEGLGIYLNSVLITD
jgi:hypothetical protein